MEKGKGLASCVLLVSVSTKKCTMVAAAGSHLMLTSWSPNQLYHAPVVIITVHQEVWILAAQSFPPSSLSPASASRLPTGVGSSATGPTFVDTKQEAVPLQRLFQFSEAPCFKYLGSNTLEVFHLFLQPWSSNCFQKLLLLWKLSIFLLPFKPSNIKLTKVLY